VKRAEFVAILLDRTGWNFVQFFGEKSHRGIFSIFTNYS